MDVKKFEIESGKVIVSDPCYEVGTWCMGVLENVKKGAWLATVEHSYEGRWGKRVAELIAFHESCTQLDSLTTEKTNIVVGVDSGQAGIFDEKYYRNDTVLPKNFIEENNEYEEDYWYEFCCYSTVIEERWDVIPYGVVSCAGFGDGPYSCYVHKNDNQEIDFIKIIYIPTEWRNNCD